MLHILKDVNRPGKSIILPVLSEIKVENYRSGHVAINIPQHLLLGIFLDLYDKDINYFEHFTHGDILETWSIIKTDQYFPGDGYREVFITQTTPEYLHGGAFAPELIISPNSNDRYPFIHELYHFIRKTGKLKVNIPFNEIVCRDFIIRGVRLSVPIVAVPVDQLVTEFQEQFIVPLQHDIIPDHVSHLLTRIEQMFDSI